MNRPFPRNEAATLANKVLRIAVDMGRKAAKTALLAQAPYLGWPVISNVVDFLLGYVADFFYQFLAEHATFVIIDFQTEADKNAFLDAMYAYNQAEQGGNGDEIAEAKRKRIEAFSRLVRWRGSAPA